MAKKVWITAAVTGGIHTPSMSPYLPITPRQIVDDAVGAYEAGAAILHMHAREPEQGRPSSDIAIMKEIVSEVKKRCDAVLCITTGGGVAMPLEERLSPIPLLQPEVASLNAGSVNFVLSPAANGLKKGKPKYDWEIPYLENTFDYVFINTFKAIDYCARTMNEAGTRPEFEVYDVAMINNIAYFIQKGVVKTPPYLQFVMGILGGIPATVENLAYMVKTARELIGDFHWSVAAAGKHQFPMAAAALAMGGNVRVGLEDNVYLRPGILAKSSAEQVVQVKEIIERIGLQTATTSETRAMLGLKGKDKVNF